MTPCSLATPHDFDALWQDLLGEIPRDVNQSALDTRTIIRKRAITSGEDLLRMCFAYGLGLSLRQVAAWAHTAEIATLNDTSLLDRLKLCGFWLSTLLTAVLTKDLPQPGPLLTRRIRLVDASVICRPKASGTDWRIHLSLDLARQVFDDLTLTDVHGGESLTRFTVAPQDLFLVDRGYCSRANIAHVVSQDADLIVRINWQNLPLQHRNGQTFDLMEALRTLSPGQSGSWNVQTRATGDLPACAGRVVVMRFHPEAAAKARAAAGKRNKKHGHRPDDRTLESAEYLILFTTLTEEEAPSDLVCALYRVRWQIEIAIKRLKSDLHLDDLRANNTALCETYLLANLLLIVLLDRLREQCLSFSPSGPDTTVELESADTTVARLASAGGVRRDVFAEQLSFLARSASAQMLL